MPCNYGSVDMSSHEVEGAAQHTVAQRRFTAVSEGPKQGLDDHLDFGNRGRIWFLAAFKYLPSGIVIARR